MKSGGKKSIKGVGQGVKRKKGKAKTKPKSGINRKTGSERSIKAKSHKPRGGAPARSKTGAAKRKTTRSGSPTAKRKSTRKNRSSQSQNPRKKPRKNPVKGETTLKKRSNVINYFGRSNEP